ncbi:MAG: hydrogenase 4 subunit F [bacterium]|nr:hydrogenase 4 subunit F [bacterium]
MLLIFLLGVPLLLAAGIFLARDARSFGIVNVLGYFGMLIASVLLLREVVVNNGLVTAYHFLVADTLSAYFIFVIAVVALATALYSIGYINKDIAQGSISGKKAKTYYLLFNLFCFSMFLVPLVNNLGLMWVAIEMTTLVSAFLVGFYNTKKSVEAAWKYIIICSAGIIFALLGTILFSYAFSISGCMKSLNWTEAVSTASALDPKVIKIAFIFILVGYGTKAGLAPMHNWLPDAHSQAVGPVSALLSGVLLKTAIYAILRFGFIVIKSVGFAYFGHLLLLLGIVSLAISCCFILIQKDLKRLLAYSSIEHIGIIAIGLGLGTPWGFLGALLHIFNHAVTKSLMFFGASNMVRAYNTHNLHSIRGVIKALPYTGIIVLLGMFALTGFPPFSIFISEFLIIMGAFNKGAYVVAGAILLFLVVIFGAFIYRFSEMLFGHLPKNMTVQKEPLSGKIAFAFLLILICATGPALIYFREDLLCLVQILLPL